jgi:nucleoside-diphosphate-sugar epimerase
MRVLLTGGVGFVGSHVARRIVQAGCDVVAVVRPGRDTRVLAELGDRLTVVTGDLQDAEALTRALELFPPDLCLHLAWYVVPGRYLSAPENLDAVAASASLLRALSKTSCRRIVVASTCAEYADADDCVNEESAIEPRTLYAACKRAVSLMTAQVAADRGWTAVTARLFQVYGPREPEPRLIPSVIRTLVAGRPCPLTNGDQVRDFLHAEDVADALWAVTTSERGGAVNIASGIPTTVAAAASEIARQLGRPELLQLGALPTHPSDAASICARRGWLHEELGWKPRFDLASGLAHTIEWWRWQIRNGTPAVL